MTALRDATPAQRRTGSPRAPLRRLAVTALALGAVVAPAGLAGAAPDDPTQGGLWYVDAMQLDDVHGRATGDGITVAVLDTQVNPDVADLADADLTVAPDNYCEPGEPVTTTDVAGEHGTNMAARIAGTGAGVGDQPGIRGIAPGARVVSYVISDGPDRSCEPGLFAEAIRAAVADGADILSMSTIVDSHPELVAAVAEAQRAGVVLVSAVPNAGTLTANDWPVYGNGVVRVESGDVTSTVQPPRLASPMLSVVAPGDDLLAIYPDDATGDWTQYMLVSGTSDATAVTAGALAVGWSAHPDATANQMIQSLVRNTGTDPKPDPMLRDDDVGFGFVSLPRLVDTDPTDYPDTNPLISDDADAVPTRAEIEGAGTPEEPSAETPADEVTSSPAPDAEEGDGGGMTLVLVLGIVAALAVAGAAAAAVALARRRR